MKDGTNKYIKDIKDGDEFSTGTVKRAVSGIMGYQSNIFGKSKIVFIKKNSLGENLPNEDTYATRAHPILVNGEYVQAEDQNDNNNIYFVAMDDTIFYNLEMEGTDKFVANGLEAGDLNVQNIKEKEKGMIATVTSKINELKCFLTSFAHIPSVPEISVST